MFNGEFHWAYPAAFFILPLIPAVYFIISRLRRRTPGIKYSLISPMVRLAREHHQKIRYIPIGLRVAALFLLVAVIARPQGVLRSVDKEVESLDIMMVMDLSESMRANDMQPNRLAVAKKVFEKFIRKRSDDRIGLVVFSGTPLTLAPLTMDHQMILEQLGDVHTNTIGVDGTAMGEGLLMAVNRLLDDRGDSRSGGMEAKPARQIVILATDGVNNMGAQPALAAKIIAEKKMKLYSIGLGGEKRVRRYERDYTGKMVPLCDIYGRPQYWERPDEKALQTLAVIGGGKYFSAYDSETFDQVMDEINGLEKNRVSLKREHYYSEHYFWLLILALALLGVESLLRGLRFQMMT